MGMHDIEYSSIFVTSKTNLIFYASQGIEKTFIF